MIMSMNLKRPILFTPIASSARRKSRLMHGVKVKTTIVETTRKIKQG
jgi:hypothetical protein